MATQAPTKPKAENKTPTQQVAAATKKPARVKFTPSRFERINAHLQAADDALDAASAAILELLKGRQGSDSPVVTGLRDVQEDLAKLENLKPLQARVTEAQRKFEDLL